MSPEQRRMTVQAHLRAAHTSLDAATDLGCNPVTPVLSQALGQAMSVTDAWRAERCGS